MNPTEFGAAAAAIITALADLVDRPIPETTDALLGEIADDIDNFANGMLDGAAREALQETVAFLRSQRGTPG